MDGQSFFLSGCDVLIIFHKSTGQSFRINSFYLKNIKKEGKNKENILWGIVVSNSIINKSFAYFSMENKLETINKCGNKLPER